MSDEKVSVIIPHYNQFKYLPEALDTVFAQTHKPHQIIVVDDGSTDWGGADEALCRIGIECYGYSENKGIGYARQYGLEKATGDWIAFLSADDLWDAQFLEKALRVARETGSKAVYCDYLRKYDDGRLEHFREFHMPNQQAFWVHAWSRCNVMFSGLVVHKSICDKVGYDVDLRYGEDYLFLLKSMKLTKYEHIQEPLAIYRIHGGQTTWQDDTFMADMDKTVKDRAREYWNEIHS